MDGRPQDDDRNRKAAEKPISIDPAGRVPQIRDSIGGDHVIPVPDENVSDTYLAVLGEDGVSYIFARPKGDGLPDALAQLASVFGVGKLLLEGGGGLNAAVRRTA